MRTNNTPKTKSWRYVRSLSKGRPGSTFSVGRAMLFATFSLFLACGPGGSDTADNGGMSGTGISQGSVTAFGSIFVNGIEWDVASAMIDNDGTQVTENELRLGMVVRVEGNFDSSGTTGVATSVSFDDSLEGPITSNPIDVGSDGLERSFEVLGTTVIMHDLDTVFSGGEGFLTLADDDVVEISGFVDSAGAIHATRIEFKGDFSANQSAELHGFVMNLIRGSGGTGSFQMGTILVRYTSATTFDDVTPATLNNGDFVEAEGTLQIAGSSFELIATKIERESQGLSGDAEEVEVEGIVSNFVSISSFTVSGTPINATNASFEPINLILANGSKIEVEGSLQNGVLIAEKVKSEEDDVEDTRIEAAVTSIDAVARTLVILGVTVSADGSTRIEDDRDDDENFLFREIQAGDWLSVRGQRIGPSSVLGSRIERDEDEDNVFLEGPVTVLDASTPAISILDQPILLDALATTRYFDSDGNERGEAEFFGPPGFVALGDIVRATDESALDLDLLGVADLMEVDDD